MRRGGGGITKSGAQKRSAAVCIYAGLLRLLLEDCPDFDSVAAADLVYDGFEHYGIDVVAAFDISPAQVGALRGKPIYPMERLKEIAERENVKLGILTVPGDAAQQACDAMVEAGITAILSFAPAYVRVPEGVTLRCEDLAATLASLSAEAEKSGA